MRGYLLQLAQRYVPFLLVITVLLFLVLQAPTTAPTRTVTAAPAYTGTPGGYGSDSASTATTLPPTGADTIGTGQSEATKTTVGPVPTGATSGTAPPGPASVGTTTGSAQPSASGPTNPGGQAADQSADTGVAVSGVRCGPGVRQVTWSPYAPPCLPRWSGNNGGTTSKGVTATTVTISYREEAEAADISAMNSILPGLIPNDTQVLSDLDTYVNFFNSQYELYGRKVVIKPYMAQGDALQEFLGQDTQGAQEDAATAASEGAFADLTPIPTPLYTQALVQNQVISFNNLLTSTSELEQDAPYIYSVIPPLDQLAKLLVSTGCKIGETPVSFAGNTALDGKQRVFGVIVPEDPQFESLENTVLNGLKACGIKIPVVINYAIDLSTIQSQADNAVSQMKAAGVTTVICGCDPVGQIYVTQAAANQDYYPEWAAEWLPDQFERLADQSEWEHSIEIGLGSEPPPQDVEAYQVFKMANPNGQPAEPYYPLIYYFALYLFNGLQAAGPDLTPQTLLHGFQSLPDSPLGQAGVWSYGPGIYWPLSEAQVSYWDPTKISAYDGKAGDFAPCFGGKWFSINDTNNFPTSINCPGQPA